MWSLSYRLQPATIACLISLGSILLLGILFASSPPSSSSSSSPSWGDQRSPSVTTPSLVMEKIRRSSQQDQDVDDEDEDDYEEPIRMGSCSQVSYGTLDLTKNIPQPKDLPLNELLIHLDHPASVSTPNPNGPVIVDIGLHVVGIADLDPGSNTFFMEGYLDLIWCDSRVRFNETLQGGLTSHMYLETDAAKELEEIWWPSITFVNEVNPRNIENQEVIIDMDGTIEYREKFGVKLSSNYEMKQFPFDRQILIAEIESFAWNSNILQFHIEDDLVGFSDEFEIPEYELTGIEEHLRTKMEARDRHPFSELVAEIYVLHIPTYYTTKVLVPLALIVCISWAVFWMDCNDLADRMAISFTGVLTSVAYQFVVAESLPRHIYNTFLDNFVLISFVMMISTVVINIIVHAIWTKGMEHQAQFIDKICRICFPALFVACVFVLAGAQIIKDYMSIFGVIAISLAAFAIVGGIVFYKLYLYNKKQQVEEVLPAGSLLSDNHDNNDNDNNVKSKNTSSNDEENALTAIKESAPFRKKYFNDDHDDFGDMELNPHRYMDKNKEDVEVDNNNIMKEGF